MVVPVAQPPPAFNLECEGTAAQLTLVNGILPRTDSEGPMKIVLRIDLAKGRWCQAECKETDELVGANERVIVFLEKSSEGAGSLAPLKTHMYVDRETGAYTKRIQIGELVYLDRGACQPKPFTGLTVPKF